MKYISMICGTFLVIYGAVNGGHLNPELNIVVGVIILYMGALHEAP